MADPEMPEVRAEQQRRDKPQANPRYDRVGSGLGLRLGLWAAFLIAIVAVVGLAYTIA